MAVLSFSSLLTGASIGGVTSAHGCAARVRCGARGLRALSRGSEQSFAARRLSPETPFLVFNGLMECCDVLGAFLLHQNLLFVEAFFFFCTFAYRWGESKRLNLVCRARNWSLFPFICSLAQIRMLLT